jgi:glycosyltransferase involved in cell wall biosynthesis/spore maturation protein CgeB
MGSAVRWRVLLLDTKLSNPNHYICLAIEKALASDARVEFIQKATLGNAIEIAKKNACNLFFAFDGEELHTDICARLRLICGQAILWVTEDPYELPINLRNADLFDRIFTNDSASVEKYSRHAVHLPFAGSPWLHQQKVRDTEECIYDLLFVGTAWPNRVALLRTLMDGISNLKTKFALPTNPFLPPIDLNLPTSEINWRTSNSDFVRLANASKVVLTLHRDFTTSIDTPSTAATPGPRLFEIALAGTCQLVDGSLPEVTQYFEAGREIEVFNGAPHALERLRELLNNPQKRDDMALAAQERAMRDHTYAHRISEILDQLQILKPEPNYVVNTSSRPRVLLLAHNVLGEGSWGGVEVYIDWIRRTVADRFEIWTYVPRHGTNGRTTVLRNDCGEIIESYSFSDALHDSVLTCSERELIFSKILQKYEFRAVHVHHLIGHPPSLPLIARSLGVATMISLHDYYAACHHFTLVGDTGRYCEIEQRNESDCDFCLSSTIGANPGAIARRRGWWRRVLGSFDILHANTIGLRERFETVYGSLSKHSGWSVMGIPIDKAPEVEVVNQNGPLRIAVPGNFTRFKGAHTLITVLRQLQGEKLEVTLLGRVDEEFKHILRNEGLDHVRCVGNYMPDELHKELIGHHVSLHVSMWPETWCLTLSESWRAGLIPIVTDIGALGERVSDGKNGFLIPINHPSQLVNKLRDLAHDRSILIEMRKNISEGDILYSRDHGDWLCQHYSNLVGNTIFPKIDNLQGLTVSQAGFLSENPNWYSVGKSLMHIPIIPSSSKHRVPFFVKLVRYYKNNGAKATVLKAGSVIKNKFI